MPLPPYIHEKLEDKDRYQTVYAKEKDQLQHPLRAYILRQNYWMKFSAKGYKLDLLHYM